MRRVLFALVALAALAAAAQAQQLPAADLVPAGKTIAYLEVSDWSRVEGAFKSTDLGQAWDSLAAFRENLQRALDAQLGEQKAEFEQQSGAKWDDVVKVLQGGFAAAVVDTAPPGGEPQMSPVFIFPPSARATVAALVENMKKKQEGQNGPPLYVVDREGAVAVAMDQNALVSAGEGAGPKLSGDPQFQSLRVRVIGTAVPGFWLYANVAAIVERTARDPEMRRQLDAAGVTAAKAMGIGLSFEGGQVREVVAVNAPGERRGLAKILSSGRPLELDKLGQQTPGNCLSFSAMRLDARGMLDQLLELAKALDPNAEQELAREIDGLEQSLGMKLREDLLDPLGDLLTVESSVPEDGLLPETVISVTVKDAAKVQSMLAEFAKQTGFDVKSVDRGGRRISYLQSPLGKLGEDPTHGMSDDRMAAQAFMSGLFSAWTIDQGRLFLASLPQALEDRFERLQKGSLSEQELWKRAVAQSPGGARMFSWTKTRPFAGVAYHVALKVIRGLEPMIRRAGVAVDTALLPRPTGFAKSFQMSRTVFASDDEGFTLISTGGVPILTALPVLAGAAGFAFKAARQRPAGPEQIEWDLRMLASAQMQWKEMHGSYASSPMELVSGGMIDNGFLKRGAQMGVSYEFATSGEGFQIIAHPMRPGMMPLMIDQSFEVRPPGTMTRPEPQEPQVEPAPPAPGGGGTMSMSDDAHKLYQAAAMTGDAQMIVDICKKIGLLNADGTPTDGMEKFTTEHGAWAQNNIDFITKEVDTQEKAKEYVRKHSE